MNIYLKVLITLSLLYLQSCSSSQVINCAYIPHETESNKYPELTQYDNCAQLDINKKITINKAHLDQIWFNTNSLAQIRVHDGIYYLNTQGKMIKSYIFDNGADYFQEGLSRFVLNNKIGFINEKLEIVIQPKYDFAYPFENGASKVCSGCSLTKVGEHKEVRGGQWGLIDKTGKILKKISYKFDDLTK